MEHMRENVLEIRELVKDFPGVKAVNNVSFDIKRNTVHCLVGENGAGKSTLIKILTTLLAPTQGKAWVTGLDVEQDAEKVRPLIYATLSRRT